MTTRISPTGNGKLRIFDTIDSFAEYFVPIAHQANSSSWQGGMNGWQALQAARQGHPPSVELSEKYLGMFESLSFQARKWNTVDAIAGGAPNIGAHLAGSPLAMRRRQRVMDDFAPLTVFCDVVSSASVDADYLKKRGAAVLALVRMLGATRPVSLYAVGGMGGLSNGYVMVKMPDVTDLSRAAFVMAHPAAARGMLYQCCARVEPGVRGRWAFNDVARYRRLGLQIYSEAVGAPIADCLYVPPIYSGEETIVPEKWLPEMLAKYGAAAEV
jgi:hypothetical protein